MGLENIEISQDEIHHVLPTQKVKTITKPQANKPKNLFSMCLKPRQIDVDDVGVVTPKESDIFTPTYAKAHIQLPSKKLIDETILDVTQCNSVSSNGAQDATTNATKQSVKRY